MAYADHTQGSRRITTVAGVMLVHAALGYALVSGMAVDFVSSVTRTLTTTNVPLPVPPPEPEAPPPPSERALPQPRASTMITTVDPIVPDTAATDVVHVDLIPLPPLPTPTLVPDVPPAPPPAPPAASKATGVRAKGDRGAWITTADYPPAAIRAGEQGVVGVALRIDAAGRVASCVVTQPSGSATLDDATCRLYQRRGRFAPARDDAGVPVAATFADRVRWELPR
jgi:protein TonB